MAEKTYRIQVVWNDVGGSLAFVTTHIIWDSEDPKSVPRLKENGVELNPERLKKPKSSDVDFDFVYETPGFVSKRLKR